MEKRGLVEPHQPVNPTANRRFDFDKMAVAPVALDPILSQKLEYYNSPHFIKTTSTVFPDNFNLHQKSCFPCAAIITPFMNVVSCQQYPVPSLSDLDPMRCIDCKSFSNPFWEFLDGGKSARCNICGLVNKVDQKHFSELGEDGYPSNIQDRVELMNGAFEINVGEEFANKTPSYPSYLFVVDVGAASIKSGVAQSAFSAIHAALKGGLLSNQPQSTFGIVCIDSKLHLIKFNPYQARPQIVTMSGNFETCPIPAQQMLICAEDISEEGCLDSILSLHEAFALKSDGAKATTSIPVKSIVLLSNIIMKTNGGKVSVILANEDVDWGASLSVDPSIQARNLHLPSNNFYSQSGGILSVNQISIDFFVFSNEIFHNLVTLTDVGRSMASQIHYYPKSHGGEVQKFYNEFWNHLTRGYSWETGLRMRLSGEWNKKEYGNFNFKVKDLMSLGPVDE